MSEAEYNHALDQIVNYLTVRGIECNLHSNTFAYYPEDDRITCASNSHGTISMICGLLHEAGHAVQPSSVFTTLRRSKKRDVAIIIEQEYKAWESGWDIARVCNICTDSLHAEYIRSWMYSWSRYIQQISVHADNAEYIARVQSGYKLRQT
jgi:hypothetical protein